MATIIKKTISRCLIYSGIRTRGVVKRIARLDQS